MNSETRQKERVEIEKRRKATREANARTNQTKESQNLELSSDGTVPNVPDLDTFRTWIVKDLEACYAFLGMVMSHPDLVNEIADRLYKRAKEPVVNDLKDTSND